ncbi:hypothetical protein ACIRPH_31130 [Nocardiopsis sp. NPDC101807]|uniref:hypothetical protein n=1 Tax=Nocardiopsis sp. NPDC101807 TaxID=3364339 RepID=UPI0037F1BAE3
MRDARVLTIGRNPRLAREGGLQFLERLTNTMGCHMDIAALIISVLAVIAAGLSAYYAFSQKGAAWEQAGDARISATAAKESARYAEEQVQLSQQALEAEERARYEARQPYVIVDIRPSDSIRKIYNLVIENIGPSVARDVQFAWDPPIRRMDADDAPYPIADARPFTHGIPMLPPGGKIVMFFGVATTLKNFDVDMFTVTVSATGPDDIVEKHTYEIDLRLRRGVMYHDEHNFHDAVTQLEILADQARKLREDHRPKDY